MADETKTGAGQSCGTVCGTGTPAASEELIASLMLAVPGWTRKGNLIEQTFVFPSDLVAAGFFHAVAVGSNLRNHHAYVTGCFSTWTYGFTTHSAGDMLTTEDFDLAKMVSMLAEKFGAVNVQQTVPA